MKRKDFIHQCGTACVAGAVLATWLQSCAAQKPVAVSYNNNQLIVPVSSFFTEKDGEKKWKRSITVRHEKTNFPIVVFRPKENEYKALLLRCTHQGQELNVYGDLITCTAHGSEFSTTGEVLQGPAETRLETYPVTSDNQNIYIRIA